MKILLKVGGIILVAVATEVAVRVASSLLDKYLEKRDNDGNAKSENEKPSS